FFVAVVRVLGIVRGWRSCESSRVSRVFHASGGVVHGNHHPSAAAHPGSRTCAVARALACGFRGTDASAGTDPAIGEAGLAPPAGGAVVSPIKKSPPPPCWAIRICFGFPN